MEPASVLQLRARLLRARAQQCFDLADRADDAAAMAWRSLAQRLTMRAAEIEQIASALRPAA
jgi:hypothetical protein